MLLKKKSKLRENSWMHEDDSTDQNLEEVNSLVETDEKISSKCYNLNKTDSNKQTNSKINFSSEYIN